jgi:hypothetical protein
MRFHPESPFGKAWAAHYAAKNLEGLAEEARRAEYDRFCTEWDRKMAPHKM